MSSTFLRAAFTHLEPKSAKMILKSSVILHFWNQHAWNLCVNMLVKSTPGCKAIKCTLNEQLNRNQWLILIELWVLDTWVITDKNIAQSMVISDWQLKISFAKNCQISTTNEIVLATDLTCLKTVKLGSSLKHRDGYRLYRL